RGDLDGRPRPVRVVDGVVDDEVVVRRLGAVSLEKREAPAGRVVDDVVPGHPVDRAVEVDGRRALAVLDGVTFDAPVRDQAVAPRADVRVDLDAVRAGVRDLVPQDGRVVGRVRDVDAVLAAGVDDVVLD